jgi:hypothetical protein
MIPGGASMSRHFTVSGALQDPAGEARASPTVSELSPSITVATMHIASPLDLMVRSKANRPGVCAGRRIS